MRIAPTEAELAQSLRIAAERLRTGVSPVKQGDVPFWLYKELIRARPDKPLALKNRMNTYSKGAVLFSCLRCPEFGDVIGWLDHWGSSVIGGQLCFVSEPYWLSDDGR